MPSAVTSRRGGGGGRGSAVSSGRGAPSRRGGMPATRSGRHSDDIDEGQTGLACQQFWEVNTEFLKSLGLANSKNIHASIEKDAKGGKFRFTLPVRQLSSPEKQQLATSYKKAHHRGRSVLVIIESDDTIEGGVECLREWGVKVNYMTAVKEREGESSFKQPRQVLAEISNTHSQGNSIHAKPRAHNYVHNTSTPQRHHHQQFVTPQREMRASPDSSVGVLSISSELSSPYNTAPPPPPADLPVLVSLPGLVSLPSSCATTPREMPKEKEKEREVPMMDGIPALLKMEAKKAPKGEHVQQQPPQHQQQQQQQQQAHPQGMQSHMPPRASFPTQPAPPAQQQIAAQNSPLQHLPNTRYQVPMQSPAAGTTTHNPYGTMPQHQQQQSPQHQQHQQQSQQQQVQQQQPQQQPQQQNVASPAVSAASPVAAAQPRHTAAACSPPIPINNIASVHAVQATQAPFPCGTANDTVSLIDHAGSVTTFSTMATGDVSKLVWSGGKIGHTVVHKVSLNYDLSGVELRVDSHIVNLRFPDAMESVKKLKDMCENMKSTVACSIDLSWTEHTDKWKRTTTLNNETRVAYDPYAISPAKPMAAPVAQPVTATPTPEPHPQGRSLLPESNFASDALPQTYMRHMRQGSHASQSSAAHSPALPASSPAAVSEASTPATLKKLNANAMPFVPGSTPEPAIASPLQPPTLTVDVEPVPLTFNGVAATPAAFSAFTQYPQPKEFQFRSLDEKSHEVRKQPDSDAPTLRRIPHNERFTVYGVQTVGVTTWGKLGEGQWCLMANAVDGCTYLHEM